MAKQQKTGTEKGTKPGTNAKPGEIPKQKNLTANTSGNATGDGVKDNSDAANQASANKQEPTGAGNPEMDQATLPDYNLLLAVGHNKTVVILKSTEELSRAPKLTLPKTVQDHLIPGMIFFTRARIITKKVMEVPTTEIDQVEVVRMGEIL